MHTKKDFIKIIAAIIAVCAAANNGYFSVPYKMLCNS